MNWKFWKPVNEDKILEKYENGCKIKVFGLKKDGTYALLDDYVTEELSYYGDDMFLQRHSEYTGVCRAYEPKEENNGS